MEILLQQHELLDLGKHLTGGTVICQSGCCWLTLAGDDRDHILRAGDCFRIAQRGQLVITATEHSRLMLVAEPETLKSTPWQPLICSN